MKTRSREGSVPDIAASLTDTRAEASEAARQTKVQRRGAEMALTTITGHFGPRLLGSLGKVWEAMTGQILEQVKPGHLGMFIAHYLFVCICSYISSIYGFVDAVFKGSQCLLLGVLFYPSCNKSKLTILRA